MSEEIYRKERIHTGPGKGDKDRTKDRDAFREGWERIFGKKGKKKNELPIQPTT
jgi:hypothetical protein